jgi:hypothetical protein
MDPMNQEKGQERKDRQFSDISGSGRKGQVIKRSSEKYRDKRKMRSEFHSR